jgi:hypothetical protein
MVDNTSFEIPRHLIEKYFHLPSPFGFNGLGEFVYQRTYARVKPDGSLETWPETVWRVVNGTYTMQKQHVITYNLGWSEDKGLKSALEMYDRIFHLKFTPPGRGLWTMGTDVTKKKNLFAALNNCAFVTTEDIDTAGSLPFKFLMDMSMLGVGVGFDVNGDGKINVNIPQNTPVDITRAKTELSNTPFIKRMTDEIQMLKSKVASDNIKVQEMYNSMIRLCEDKINSIMKDSISKPYITMLSSLIQKYKEKFTTETNEWVKSALEKDIKMYEKELIFATSDRDFHLVTIGDTREGWVDSVGELIDSYFMPNKLPVVFDYSEIRPAGVLLKTFGGVSSGPEPLVDLHVTVRTILEANAGKPITTRTITDIMNLIGKAVVAGNVRRCLPRGTLVHTTGGIIPIEDIIPGMRTVSVRGYQTITELIPQGQQPVYTIRTEIGNIRCTLQHRLAVYPNEFRRVDELLATDRLIYSPTSHFTNSIGGVSYAWEFGNQYTGENVPSEILCGEFEVRNAFIHAVNGRVQNKYTEALMASVDNRDETLPVEILNIDNESQLMDTFDLVVENTHEFVIDCGIISHNSSEIALSQQDDLDNNDFLNLKNYSVNPERASWGWASNNTVITKVGANYSDIAQRIVDNGEPGLFWLETAQQYGRMSDAPNNKDFRAKGTNPSMRKGTRVLTDRGILPIELLEKSEFKVRNLNGKWSPAECFLSGRSKPLYKIVLSTSHSYYATAEHKWPVHISGGTWKKVASTELTRGMKLPYYRGDTLHNVTYNKEEYELGLLAANIPGNIPAKVWSDSENFRRGYLVGVLNGHGKFSESVAVILIQGFEYANDISDLLGFYGIKNIIHVACLHGEGVAASTSSSRSIGTQNSAYSATTIGTLAENNIYNIMIVESHSLKQLAELFAGSNPDINKYLKYPSKEMDYVMIADVTDTGLREDVWDITVHDDTHCFQLAHCITGNCCFHEDTYIVVADGRSPVKIKDLAKEGLDVPVLSMNLDGTNCVKWARTPHQTGAFCDLVDVVLADGNIFRVTPEHRFFTQKGKIKCAKDLIYGDILPSSDYGLITSAPPNEMIQSRIITITCEGCNCLFQVVWNERNTCYCSLKCRAISHAKPPPVFAMGLECLGVRPVGGKFDVYNLTVDQTHIVAIALPSTKCVFTYQSEQTLESNEMCNLVETYPSRHESRDDFLRTLKFAYLYAKTVTLGGSHWISTNRIMMRNRRIGCSVSGVAELITKVGVANARQWLRDGYNEIQKWDTIYSEYLAIPKSIKTTSVNAC